jgi:hypothetical protein
MRSSRSLALARTLGSQPGRISLVRALSSQAREGWRLLPSGLRVRHVKSGELGDDPVDVGQTVRVQYSARLEDGREVVSKLVASFRVGGGGVCAAIDDGVVGMRVGDRRRVRAPPNLPRGRALAEAPLGEMLEYDMTLTGAVHHMNMVTLDQYGSDDPIEQLVDYTKRALSFLNSDGGGKPKPPPSKSSPPPPPSASSNSFPRPKRSVPKA